MKTKDLIKLLQENDPDGEMDVVIGGAAIDSLQVLPGYYDGCYGRIIHENPDDTDSKIIAYELTKDGCKLDIRTLGFNDILFLYPEVEIKYDGEYSKRLYEDIVNKKRQEVIDQRQDLESDSFTNYVIRKLKFDSKNIREISKKWALENIRYNDPMPKDIQEMALATSDRNGLSWNSRRELQWDREITVKMDNDSKIIIAKISN